MLYTSVTLRGEVLEVSYRVIEDDPTTNVFEADWYFTDPPEWAGDLVERELDEITTAIAEAAYDRAGDDLD